MASRDEEPSPKNAGGFLIPDTNAEYTPDKTPLKTEYHRKKTKKNVFDVLYFLNFMIKLNMILVVYAVTAYLLMLALLFFACSNGMYECRNFCVKIWVVTRAVGTYDNTIKRILLLLLLFIYFSGIFWGRVLHVESVYVLVHCARL